MARRRSRSQALVVLVMAAEPRPGSRCIPSARDRKISVTLVATEPPALLELGAKRRDRASRALPRNPCSRRRLGRSAKPILGDPASLHRLPLRAQLSSLKLDDRSPISSLVLK